VIVNDGKRLVRLRIAEGQGDARLPIAGKGEWIIPAEELFTALVPWHGGLWGIAKQRSRRLLGLAARPGVERIDEGAPEAPAEQWEIWMPEPEDYDRTRVELVGVMDERLVFWFGSFLHGFHLEDRVIDFSLSLDVTPTHPPARRGSVLYLTTNRGLLAVRVSLPPVPGDPE
jgi:hypothetical protein